MLIVDDNERLAESLKRNFELRGHQCKIAGSGSRALEQLSTNDVHLLLLDIRLAGESGLDLLDLIRKNGFDTPVVVITGNATLDNAIGALQKRVVDFIRKPIDFEELYTICERFLAADSGLDDAPESLIHTENAELRAVMRDAAKIAQTDIPVLITGESGTGKELLADFLHQKSDRRSREMYKVNCASLPETLLESELFGHAKGSFTGAIKTHQGIFEKSDGSTLFLDEIGDMPLSQQAKILRVLQNSEVKRIGGFDLISVNVRFIAATNRDVDTAVRTGVLREDLFYRLNAGHLHLPPLRDRVEDIVPLANHFLASTVSAAANGQKRISADVLDLFRHYHWPGNVRELKNAVRYSSAVANAETIEIGDLPRTLRMTFQSVREISPGMLPGNQTIDGAERDLIRRTLITTGNNKTEAARILNISRSTLYEKIAKYGLADGSERTADSTR